MGLRQLQVTDFRCLRSASLDFDPQYTLISGPNASGKTSLLEAIYLLGRGRSFRTRKPGRLIRFDAEQFIVFGQIENAGVRVPLGIEGRSDGMRARISGRDATSMADVALQFPVQIIDPEVHRLIEEGPHTRRRFLDWGVFHVEPRFLASWHRYRQALSQRNAALRAGQNEALVSLWNPELIRAGTEMSEARCSYVAALAASASPVVERLLGARLTLRYQPGWAQDVGFAQALERTWIADVQRGATQVGPHRGELIVQIDGLPAREHISRGQQKLLAAALLIAQLELFAQRRVIRPTLLLDDPAAELDDGRLGALLVEVLRVSPQLIVTTLQPRFAALGQPGVQWRVEAGSFSALD